jgi:hypothetical protein
MQFSLSKTPWSCAMMANLSSPRINKTEQLHGIIITSNTEAQPISKRLCALQCIGTLWDIPSDHMSNGVTVARWTNNASKRTANCQLNLLSPTVGRYFMWISLDHIPSRTRAVHKLTVCVSQW